MAGTRRTIWGIGTSRTIRAHWAAAEVGLDYETRAILPRTGETKTEEFTAINPRQKLPVLQDGDLTLSESLAILTYLATTYGDPATGLVPVEARERAAYDEWCFFTAMELDATSLYVMRRHHDLTEIYGAAPAAVEVARDYFHRQAATVVSHLDDGRRYLMGERFTGADIALTSTLGIAERYEVALDDALLAYLERTRARPAFRAARAINNPEDLGRV